MVVDEFLGLEDAQRIIRDAMVSVLSRTTFVKAVLHVLVPSEMPWGCAPRAAGAYSREARVT